MSQLCVVARMIKWLTSAKRLLVPTGPSVRVFCGVAKNSSLSFVQRSGSYSRPCCRQYITGLCNAQHFELAQKSNSSALS